MIFSCHPNSSCISEAFAAAVVFASSVLKAFAHDNLNTAWQLVKLRPRAFQITHCRADIVNDYLHLCKQMLVSKLHVACICSVSDRLFPLPAHFFRFGSLHIFCHRLLYCQLRPATRLSELKRCCSGSVISHLDHTRPSSIISRKYAASVSSSSSDQQYPGG